MAISTKRTISLYAILFLAYIAFVAGLTIWLEHHEHDNIIEKIDIQLNQAATSLKYILPDDFHDRALDSSSISFDEERSIQDKLNRFVADNRLKYVYTLIEENGTYYFTASSVTAEDLQKKKSWYFSAYEEVPAEFKKALHTHTAVTASYKDEWGNFRSICVFEKSPAGRPYLACADLPASEIETLHFAHFLRSTLLAVGFLFFLIPFTMLIRRKHREHVHALNASHDQTRTHLSLLHNLLERLPLGLMLWEQDNTISLVNPAFSQITGYTLDDVTTRNTWFHLAYPDRLARTQALQLWANMRKGFELNPEVPICCSDGSRKICSLRGRQLHDGRTFMLISDITDRVNFQENLRANELRLRSILNSLEVGIAVIGTSDLLVRYANPKMLAMTGRTMEEMINSHCKEFVCASCAPGCPVLDQGMVVENKEQKIKSSSGEEINILKSVIPAQFDGQDVLIEAIVDITTQKRIETQLLEAKIAAEAASKAKSEFLAVMSHEIRTPLNGIMGALQLVQALAPEELEEIVRNAIVSSRGLLTILQDVLDLAAMEAGSLALQEAPFQSKEMILPVIDSLQEEATKKGITLACFQDPHLPSIFVGDVARIRQIFFNLVGNAIKFTASGSVQVEINMLPWKADHGRGQVHFMVKDTGIGIPDDKVDSVFDPFTQVDMALNRKFEGTGMGLAIVQRLIRLMGGSLCLISEQDAGTEFHFSLSLGNACPWSRTQ